MARLPIPRKKGKTDWALEAEMEYEAETADEILAHVASGDSLLKICRAPGMPLERIVRRWVIDDVDGFKERFEDAYRMYAAHLFDEAIEIADEAEYDRNPETGRVDYEIVKRSQLKVETRLKALARMFPTLYGTALQSTDSDSVSVTIKGGLPSRAK